jgi:Spy/CpxP family protein refolding chaperone
LKLAVAVCVFASPALAADTNIVSNDVNSDQIAAAPSTAVPVADNAEDHHGRQHWFSDDQLEKMAALKDSFIQKTSSQHTQLMLLHRQLREALAKPDVDRSAAQSIQSQINSVQNDLAAKHLDFKLDMMAILTPEQREHMRKHMLMENAWGGMGHHHHGCGGGGGGEHHRWHGGHEHEHGPGPEGNGGGEDS